MVVRLTPVMRGLGGLALSFLLCLQSAAVIGQTEPIAPDDGPAVTEAQPDDGATGDADADLLPIETIDLESLLATPIVESASRREQSIHDAPSAVTLVEGEQIRRMGAQNPAEVLRRVVGVHVFSPSPNEYSIGLRGRSVQTTNRVLTIVDGRTVSDPIVSVQPWTWIPLHPSEIERLEVMRGPGTTLYGSNAQNGVINITTRRPLDHPGAEGEVVTGVSMLPADDGERGSEPSVRNVSSGYAAYAWADEASTVGVRLGLGFRHAPDLVRPLASDEFTHGEFGYFTRLAVEWVQGESGLSLFGTASHSLAEALSTPSNSPVSTLYSEQAFSLALTHDGLVQDLLQMKVSLDSTRLMLSNILEVGSWTHHGLAQLDVHLFEGLNIFTMGGELTFIDISEFLDLTPTSLGLSWMFQNETRLFTDESLIFNLGARLETVIYDDGADVELTYSNFNPRLSAIWQFVEGHDLRVTAATSSRNPTPLEVSLGAPLEPEVWDAPPILLVVPNPRLEVERVRSIELGYRGEVLGKVQVDVATFLQETSGIVTVERESRLPLVFENVGGFAQLGVEVALEVAFTGAYRAYAHYTMVTDFDDEESQIVDQYPPHLFGFGLDGGLADRLNLHVDGSFTVGADTLAANIAAESTILAFERVDVPNQANINLRLGYEVLDGLGEVFLTGRNLAGFFRAPADLLQWDPTYTLPIGATALVGLRIEE